MDVGGVHRMPASNVANLNGLVQDRGEATAERSVAYGTLRVPTRSGRKLLSTTCSDPDLRSGVSNGTVI